MLKTNTVLTAACTLLLGLLAFLGHGIWDDVAAIKGATTTTAVQVQSINRELDDHESRIRQTEKDVTILQQVQHEDRTARSPRMSDNKP
jgi:hypothetical protein